MKNNILRLTALVMCVAMCSGCATQTIYDKPIDEQEILYVIWDEISPLINMASNITYWSSDSISKYIELTNIEYDDSDGRIATVYYMVPSKYFDNLFETRGKIVINYMMGTTGWEKRDSYNKYVFVPNDTDFIGDWSTLSGSHTMIVENVDWDNGIITINKEGTEEDYELAGTIVESDVNRGEFRNYVFMQNKPYFYMGYYNSNNISRTDIIYYMDGDEPVMGKSDEISKFN